MGTGNGIEYFYLLPITQSPNTQSPIPYSWVGFGRFIGLGAGVLGIGFDTTEGSPPLFS